MVESPELLDATVLLPFKCYTCGEVKRCTYDEWIQSHDHYVECTCDDRGTERHDGMYGCPGAHWHGEFIGMVDEPEWAERIKRFPA